MQERGKETEPGTNCRHELSFGCAEPRAYSIRCQPPALAAVGERGRWGRGGQLRRSDMFIVPESPRNRLKPHRGGMVGYSAGHAALRSWLAADWSSKRCLGRPNKSARPMPEERLRFNRRHD